MAFVSSLTPSPFAGTPAEVTSKHVTSPLPRAPACQTAGKSTVVMNDHLGKTISKYVRAAQRISNEPLLSSSFTSWAWNNFADTSREGTGIPVMYRDMMTELAQMGKPFPEQTSPLVDNADAYMARSVTRQYQQTACATGEYNARCAEGTTKHQAEDARVLSLGTRFRHRQASALAQFANVFELRRRAIASSHQCSYEEALFRGFSATSAASVAGRSEALGACTRTAVPESPAEGYMMRCVETQCKARAVPFGLYGIACCDGSMPGLADYRRVTTLSAKFRSAQWSHVASAQRRFDRSKFARENFAHECSYEEKLFNRFPNMAAAMSGAAANY